jgi:protein O-mannosyl-transferase
VKEKTNRLDTRPITVGMCVFLAAIVWFTFHKALDCNFLNYDDDQYVYANPIITKGLTLSAVRWAFVHVHASNWHPLTTISHMLDCSLYGLQPWGHHLTNVLLHGTAAVLLFLALRSLTSNIQPSTRNLFACAFAATLFAIHPLRVESVAWVSERKDVLSGVFFALTLLAYGRYAKSDRFRIGRYLTIVALFVLGLMSKPTLVTLPFVLLLLDYWPLGRWQNATGGKPSNSTPQQRPSVGNISRSTPLSVLVGEKIPLLFLSAGSCVATVIAQKNIIERGLQMNAIERVNNAFVSYAAYLGEMIWPAHLVVSHPYAQGYHNLPQVIASLVLLVGISAACFLSRKEHPFLLTGWLWYIGMLVPMIGVVQVSSEARSDRYTYLAQIGVYIMLSWGATSFVAKWRPFRTPLVATALAVIVAFSVRAYGQTAYWRDTETLWRHSIDVSPGDYIAYDGLGFTLLQEGRISDAIVSYEKAIQIKPNYVQAHNNLGNAYMENGRLNEAAAQYQKVLELAPGDPQVHNNLGTLLLKQGRIDEAIQQYRKAVATDPQVAELHYNLGAALITKGDWADAINHLEVALKIDPNYPEAHNKLGIALGATGKVDDAIIHFREALRLHHLYPQAHYNLGSILVHNGQREEGIAHLREAVRLKPDYVEANEQLRELGVSPSP